MKAIKNRNLRIARVFAFGLAVLTLVTLWNSRKIFTSISVNYKSHEFLTDTVLGIKIRKRTPFGGSKNLSHDRTSTRQKPTARCSLKWNIINLNVSMYESDGRYVDKKAVVNKPSLVFENAMTTLDRGKYLMPELTWGPNNQLVGFMESVLVAIKLNRTLVLPSFLKHNTDRQYVKGSRNRISPLHRIDVETLCKYMPCIMKEQFQRTCDYRIDGILNIRLLKIKDINRMEASSKMMILPLPERDISWLSNILFPLNGTSSTSPSLKFLVKDIKQLFETTARCVIYPYPFFDIVKYDKRGTLRPLYSFLNREEFQDRNASSDTGLLADIYRHVARPAYVKNIADEFIENMTRGNNFISAHWRYNKGDYLSEWHCGSKKVNRRRCDKALNYTSDDLARRLGNKVESLAVKNINISSIYIASPRTETKFILETKTSLQSLSRRLRAYSSIELEQFMKEKYHTCEFLKDHFEDILSTTEMEICSRSISFLGSLGTTWSGNVFKSRMQMDVPEHENSPDYIFRL